MQVETKTKAVVEIAGVSRTFEVYFWDDSGKEGVAFRTVRTGYASLEDIDFGKDVDKAVAVYNSAITAFTLDMMAATK